MDLTFNEEYVPVPQKICSKFKNQNHRRPEHSTSSSDDSNQEEEEYEKLILQSQSKQGRVSQEHFSLISVIGTGSYGKVFLVKKRDSGALYAMKVLKKNHIRK